MQSCSILPCAHTHTILYYIQVCSVTLTVFFLHTSNYFVDLAAMVTEKTIIELLKVESLIHVSIDLVVIQDIHLAVD